MTHKCIFCGGRVTKEHIFPAWLLDILKQPPWIRKQLHVISTDQYGRRNQRQQHTPESVTKAVCRGCNGEWMSDLENKVAPVLRPMINDENKTLTGEHQDTIAKWMLKNGMVLDSMRHDGTFYEDNERFTFRGTGIPPGYVNFWLARYSGSDFGLFTSHRILMNLGATQRYRSYVCTMSIGRLVLQALNVKIDESKPEVVFSYPNSGEWSTVELIPPFNETITWPPPGPSIEDSVKTLFRFSERFGGFDGVSLV